jgi:DNA polymerase elongation subunit (family B)
LFPFKKSYLSGRFDALYNYFQFQRMRKIDHGSATDYDHYLTRQLQPVADAILPLLRDKFATLITGQKNLF